METKTKTRDLDILINTHFAAYLAGCSERHLRRLRAKGEGPKHLKIEGNYYYSVSDLSDYLGIEFTFPTLIERYLDYRNGVKPQRELKR